MPKLRRFLYLDNEIVGQFLAQVDGGDFDEQRITDQQSRSSGIGASIGAGPASVRADRGRSGSSEAETVLKQSGPSRFNRLHHALEAEHDLSSLNVADDTIWNALEVGEIIEAVVTLEVPKFFRTINQISGWKALSPMMGAIGELASLGISGLDVSAQDLQQMSEIQRAMPAIDGVSAAVAAAPLPVIMHLVDAAEYRFIVMLDRASIAASDGLEGEARTLIKLDKHIPKGKPEHIPLIPGTPAQSRAQRRSPGKKKDDSTITIKAPAVRATCIAIYR